MSAHAVLAPSDAKRWKRCAGAVAATIDYPDSSNEYAREGTAAHVLGERALQYAGEGRRANFWIGDVIDVPYEEGGVQKVQQFTVDDEMADNVQAYVNQVMRQPGHLLVEEKFDLADVFGVEGQFGTSDAIKLDYEHKRLYVNDLKYGRGIVVFAKDNDQMYAYAGGALRHYSMLAEWDEIVVAIHQPRLNHYDEHTLTRAELEAWIEQTKVHARRAFELIGEPMEVIEAALTPGPEQCQWCPRKDLSRGGCRPLDEWTHKQVYEDFEMLSEEPQKPREAAPLPNDVLGKLVARADLIESVTREWRAEGKRRLEAGLHIPGWKLVEGRAGNRKYSSDDEAESILKAARIKQDEMYTKKVISPAQAQKKFAKKKPKVWAKLDQIITQASGAPSMAPESDPKPALRIATSEQFNDESDISDLVGEW